MRNDVEILRAVCFTKESMETIQNLGDEFEDKEIEFMIEFKKIYEFGLNQLEKFINKLDKEGKDLDEYTIQYYVTQLLNGPLGQYARKLAKDKNYFRDINDIMGMAGNNGRTAGNTSLYPGDPLPLGCNVDLYNHLPLFIQENLTDVVKQSEEFFRGTLDSFLVYDNTLPLVDKQPQQRYAEEGKGSWVLKPNGNFMVKDSWFSVNVQKPLNKVLFDSILNYLGEEDNRIFEDKKSYNAFSDGNDSSSSNHKLEKVVKEGDKKETVIIDLMGSVYDSDDKRKSVLKVKSPDKDKEYKLGTIEGQLGI